MKEAFARHAEEIDDEEKLSPYFCSRCLCMACGIYQAGTSEELGPICKCPYCGGTASVERFCRRVTTKKLPYASAPEWKLKDKFSWIRGGVQANGKCTGRPLKKTDDGGPSGQRRNMSKKK